MYNEIRTKQQLWLGGLFFSLFALFPTLTPLSNLPLLLILVTWLVLLRKPEIRAPLKQLHIVWVLIGIYALVLVGLFYTPATSEWYNLHLRKYARFLYAVVLICLLAGNEKLQDIALKGFIAAMLFIVASTWLNIWFYLPWSSSQTLGWNQSHHVFGDYITQNVMVSLFAILALHKCIEATDYKRWLWGAVALLSIVSVTNLSLGRTGFVVLFAALVTFVILKTRGKYLIAALCAVLIGAAALYSSSNVLQQRFEQAISEALKANEELRTSIGWRLYNYKTTSRMIADQPLTGHGTGSYHTEICRFLDDPQDCAGYDWHPHNQYLYLGADHGVVGIALYIALIALMYVGALRSSDEKAKILLATLASMMLVNSLINSPWWSSRESQFFSYMLALCVAMASNHLFKRRDV